MRLLLVSTLLFVVSSAFSQRLQVYRTFGGVQFQFDANTVSIKQVLEIVYDNKAAYAELRKAKKNYSVAGVLGFTGGVLIGLPLGTAILGGKPEWILAGVGGAFAIASIPLSRAFRSHAQEAVDLYNMDAPTSRINTSFYFSGNSLGLLIKF